MVRVQDFQTSQVQIPFWTPAGVVLYGPEFSSSATLATLVNKQLDSLLSASWDF